MVQLNFLIDSFWADNEEGKMMNTDMFSDLCGSYHQKLWFR